MLSDDHVDLCPGRYQDRQSQVHKAVQDMYPPGACIFLRRLKAKIVKKERKRAEREARQRERREQRDIRRQERQGQKVWRGQGVCRRQGPVWRQCATYAGLWSNLELSGASSLGVDPGGALN